MDQRRRKLMESLKNGDMKIGFADHSYNLKQSRVKSVSFDSPKELCDYVFQMIRSDILKNKELSVIRPELAVRKTEPPFPSGIVDKVESQRLLESKKDDFSRILTELLYKNMLASVHFVASLDLEDKKRISTNICNENLDGAFLKINYFGMSDEEHNSRLF